MAFVLSVEGLVGFRRERTKEFQTGIVCDGRGRFLDHCLGMSEAGKLILDYEPWNPRTHNKEGSWEGGALKESSEET